MKKIVLGILVILSVIFITGCEKEKKVKSLLVGSWENEGYIYTFKEDNTGSYSYFQAKMEFTYEEKKTVLSLLYKGSKQPINFEYKINNNKLIIKDSNGEETEYTKK